MLRAGAIILLAFAIGLVIGVFATRLSFGQPVVVISLAALGLGALQNRRVTGAICGLVLAIAAMASVGNPDLKAYVWVSGVSMALAVAGASIRIALGMKWTLAGAATVLAAALVYWNFFSFTGKCRHDSDCASGTRSVEGNGFGIGIWERYMVCDRPCGPERPPCPVGLKCASLVDYTIDGSIFGCR